MNIRVFLLIGVTTSACQDLPFSTHHSPPGTADAGPFDGGQSGNPGVAGPNDGALGIESFPGFGAVDAPATASNATDGVAVDADGGAFSIPAPWDFNAGLMGGALPFSFPSPTSLPSASTTSPDLALASLGDHPKPAMKDRLKTGHQM